MNRRWKDIARALSALNTRAKPPAEAAAASSSKDAKSLRKKHT